MWVEEGNILRRNQSKKILFLERGQMADRVGILERGSIGFLGKSRLPQRGGYLERAAYSLILVADQIDP